MRIVLVLFAAGALAVVTADWVSIGPFGGPVSAGAASPSDPLVMFVSPQSYPTPMLKTTDGGESWEPLGQLGYYAFGIAVHPTDPNIVYAACGGLYRTLNGGTSWSYVSMPGGSYTRAVVINPLNPQTIYTTGYAYNGTYQFFGLHKTTDGGTTWDTLGLDTMRYSMGYALVMDPQDTSVLYCAGYSGAQSTVFRTTDAGATWERLPLGVAGYYIYSLHCSPLDPGVVLAGTYYSGIMRSTDRGQSWSQAATFRNVKALAAVPADPRVIYGVADSLVYRSEDTGRTWTECGGNPPGLNPGLLVVPDRAGPPLFAGSKFGIFGSTDGGATWACLTDNVVYAKVPQIGISSCDPQMMYLEYKDNAVYKSTDGGQSWRRCPDFLSCGNICGFAFDPADPDVVWALEGSG